MRLFWVYLIAFCAAFAQGDRGTITGTIADPAGAVVANANIEVRNVDTSAAYQAATSATGNYTMAQLPAGNYEMTIAVPGFKRFVRQNITLPVAQTVRIDATLEVGANTESVTITEQAALLKTESGELAHNVASEKLNALPVLTIGGGGNGTGMRNPYAVLQVLPGTDYRPDSSIRVNGGVSNTQAIRIEGQESGTGTWVTQSWAQPSVDAIQEFAVQTSNYAAEFGQAGSGVFNLTMKSGTNQFHGTGYDYFVNEALNAGQPFTSSSKGLIRPRQRRNDYGFTLGGPVIIPKIYNGRDKTFFFFNFEQFRETLIVNNVSTTLPVSQYRVGDFSRALTGRTLCPAPCAGDPLGRAVLENAVYDPASDRVVNGVRTRDMFPGNVVPQNLLDPVALKMQAFLPLPTNDSLLTNNYLPTYNNPKTSTIPSFKIDHSISSKAKISGYYSRTTTATPTADGMPYPITSARGTQVATPSIRLNFDYTLSPTMLLHLGAGYQNSKYLEVVAPVDVLGTFGLKGTHADLMPTIQGLGSLQGGLGSSNSTGVQRMGPSTQIKIENIKPTGNISLTWVKNNHTFKFGGEVWVDGYLNTSNTYAAPWITFSATETTNPSLNGFNLVGGSAGFPYASFLLGRAREGYTSVPNKTHLGKHSFSGFAQDSWKVTRKLTVDYGLRYDYQTYLQADNGYQASLSPSTPNPSAGNLPGGTIFEGNGPGQCNCKFAKNYPFAFGPRLGVAYQLNSKTVMRLGIGVNYTRTGANNFQSYAVGSNTPYGPTGFSDPAYLLQNGLPYTPKFPNFDPGQLPFAGIPANTLNFFDQNAGRPARTLQYSFSLQREIARNLVVEAAYVANRGVWWQGNYMATDNGIDPATLKARGFDIVNSQADRDLLTSPVNSARAIAAGFGTLPYPTFPSSLTVAQTLRPYPEYLGILRLWNPVGNTWYDSMQLKATKRLSRGLDVLASFTWSRQLNIGAEGEVSFSAITPPVNDVLNRNLQKYLSGFDQPKLLVISANYTTQKLRAGNSVAGRVASWVARDWQLGAVLRYGSGLPIQVPQSTTNLNALLFRGSGPGQSGTTPMNRVAGQPLFLQDLNCHCFNPQTTLVLNKDAWVNPAPGTFGTSAFYYSDYRYQRRPVENMSFGRVFRVREKANLMVRAEFSNIFNRTQVANPSATNALATVQANANGVYTTGFGTINTNSVFSTPRQGQLVVRFTF